VLGDTRLGAARVRGPADMKHTGPLFFVAVLARPLLGVAWHGLPLAGPRASGRGMTRLYWARPGTARVRGPADTKHTGPLFSPCLHVARLGTAGPGRARHGMAWHGAARVGRPDKYRSHQLTAAISCAAKRTNKLSTSDN